MTLEVRVYNPQIKDWVKAAEIPPGERGSVSSNLEDGTSEIFLFECAANNSYSTIFRLSNGVDFVNPESSKREVIIEDSNDIQLLKELKAGETYTMVVGTGMPIDPTQLDLTHVQD